MPGDRVRSRWIRPRIGSSASRRSAAPHADDAAFSVILVEDTVVDAQLLSQSSVDFSISVNEETFVMDAKGLKVIAVWENGDRHITNSKRPINSPNDLQGIKLRVPEGKWRVKMFQTYGANPSPMKFSEVFTALQTGVIDGGRARSEPFREAPSRSVVSGLGMKYGGMRNRLRNRGGNVACSGPAGKAGACVLHRCRGAGAAVRTPKADRNGGATAGQSRLPRVGTTPQPPASSRRSRRMLSSDRSSSSVSV